MNMIVAVDKNWAIGHKNRRLVSIPEDMKFFRRETGGKVVVMGRKTLESFPGGLPLKEQTNLVLSKNPSCQIRGATVLRSVEEVLEELKQYPSEDVYIVGGDSIYQQFFPYCDVAHVTRIDHAYEADAWFPDLDKKEEWELTGEGEERTYFDLEFRFCRYERRRVKG